MNFTLAKNFLSRNSHTIILLLGLICVITAITFLTNFYWGLLALGFVLIGIAILLNNQQEGG
ncbi:hypothetical protein EsVE80_04680 [Enterococcus saigonensis]|uniref:Uncharacterized protein n=1 Tax=Enterococcus saigonensis TaxID=1805431 RepID=A0A679II22_9ENTE|nr:hypothetical protein EsVE80_04680 [Enterococcus saigonensis]